jgi:hypothetical protein
MTLSIFGYASYPGKFSAAANSSSGPEDISITDCIVISYNGFIIPPKISWDDTDVVFDDDLLYPGWELKLLTEITNIGPMPVRIWSEIMYWDGTSWIPIGEGDLLTLFRLDYTSGFYNDTGPDGEWFTDDDTPWTGREGDYRLWPDPPYSKVYKKEHLTFDAQDNPELQDEFFTFKVDVNAAANGNNGNGNSNNGGK